MIFNHKMKQDLYGLFPLWEINGTTLETSTNYPHIGIDRAHNPQGYRI